MNIHFYPIFCIYKFASSCFVPRNSQFLPAMTLLTDSADLKNEKHPWWRGSMNFILNRFSIWLKILNE